MAWFDEKNIGKIALPFWLQLFDYLRSVNRADVSIKTKISCFLYVLGPWLLSHMKNLAMDLFFAVNTLLRSKRGRIKKFEDTRNWS